MISQKDINSAAWSACDNFRGVMDGSAYKDYILTILFVKYISDVWKERKENYRGKYKSDQLRIDRKLQREPFQLPEGTDFDSLYNQRNATNIGELINEALEKIQRANKDKLEGIFRNIDFNSEANLGQAADKNNRLKSLLETFNNPNLDMRPSRVSEDVIGNTSMYLIERFASNVGKKAGEFYTPHKVSELVARLCKPQKGARICDPTCGSGGLLIEAKRAVGSDDYALYGMEVNGNTWALCRMNMFLHQTSFAQIEWCNALTGPALKEDGCLMKFDNIVANPPFSLKNWGATEAADDLFGRFWRGIPPNSKGDYAFITHMLEVAKPKQGRVAVIVPNGVLFRGAAEGRIRQHIIEENLLDAVIGLPNNLFPATAIPVTILIFDRSREQGGPNEGKQGVFFIDASEGYQPGKNQNALLDEHVNKIIATYEECRDVEKYAQLISLSKIKENGFSLNISLYIDTAEEEELVDIKTVQREVEDLEKELAVVREKMSVILRDLDL